MVAKRHVSIEEDSLPPTWGPRVPNDALGCLAITFIKSGRIRSMGLAVERKHWANLESVAHSWYQRSSQTSSRSPPVIFFCLNGRNDDYSAYIRLQYLIIPLSFLLGYLSLQRSVGLPVMLDDYISTPMPVLRHTIAGSGMVPPRPPRMFFFPWMVLFSVGISSPACTTARYHTHPSFNVGKCSDYSTCFGGKWYNCYTCKVEK